MSTGAIGPNGAWHEQGAELARQALGHLKTSEVGEVLERTVRRIEKHLRRRGLLVEDDGADAEGDADPEISLAASAVSGQAPPAGPQWMRGLQPLEPHALAYDKGGYRPWAELLARTFGVDVLACPRGA